MDRWYEGGPRSSYKPRVNRCQDDGRAEPDFVLYFDKCCVGDILGNVVGTVKFLGEYRTYRIGV